MIINVEIEPEFEIACDLLYLRPEEVIRAFVENVSLSNFCSSDYYLAQRKNVEKSTLSLYTKNPESEGEITWPKSLPQMATAFVFGYNALHNERLLPAQKIQKKYFKDFDKLLLQLVNEQNFAMRYCRLAIFFHEWRDAVLLNISDHDAIINVKSRKIKLKP